MELQLHCLETIISTVLDARDLVCFVDKVDIWTHEIQCALLTRLMFGRMRSCFVDKGLSARQG